MIPQLEYASQICYSSKEVLQFTYDMAVKYRDSPGVYVECGVAAGAQIIAMAAGAPNKTIYAFDSFEGIPLPSNRDNQMPGIAMLTKAEQMALPDPGKQVLESSGAVSVSVKDFVNHLQRSGINIWNVHTVQGWFEVTIPEWVNQLKDISILRLDGDLYNSTYVALKHLYPLVIKGGLVIIDDYTLPGCRQAVHDYLSEIGVREDFFRFIHGNDSTVVFWHKP